MLINRNVIITTTELNTGDIIAAGDHLIARVVGQGESKDTVLCVSDGCVKEDMSYTMFRDLDQKFYIKYLLFDYVANRVVPFKDGRLVRLPYAGEVSLLSGIKKEDICLPDYNNHWLAPWEYLSGDPRFIFSCDMKDYWLMNETGSRKINNFFHPYIRKDGILTEATPARSLGIRIVFQLNKNTD